MKKLMFIVLCLLSLVSSAHATLNSTTTRNQYTCNGSTTTFAYAFTIYEDDDLIVIKDDDTAGEETTLTLNVDYTVTGAGDDGGGNVELTSGSTCASGYNLTIFRDVELTQDTDYVNGQAFSADSLETPNDKSRMIDQQFDNRLDRALLLKLSSEYTGSLELPEPVASRAIGYNSAATGLTTYATSAVTSASFDHIDNYDDLAAAITAIATTPTTLVIDSAQTMDENVTVPSTLTLFFIDGGSITHTGYTLAINGPFYAGNHKIFVGSGTLTLGDMAKPWARPEHFGLIINDSGSAAVNVTAINNCLTIAKQCYLPPGQVYINDTIDLNAASMVLAGFQRTGSNGDASTFNASTVLVPSAAMDTSTPMAHIGAVSDVILRDLTIHGNSLAQYGIQIGTTSGAVEYVVENVAVRECVTGGVYLRNSQGGIFKDCRISNNVGHGYYKLGADDYTTATWIVGGTCSYNGGSGIYGTGKIAGLKSNKVKFENNEDWGIYIDDSAGTGASPTIRSITTDDCYFEANNNSLTAGQAHIKIDGNNTRGAAAAEVVPTGIIISNTEFGAIDSPGDSYAIDLDSVNTLVINNAWDSTAPLAHMLLGAKFKGLLLEDGLEADGTSALTINTVSGARPSHLSAHETLIGPTGRFQLVPSTGSPAGDSDEDIIAIDQFYIMAKNDGTNQAHIMLNVKDEGGYKSIETAENIIMKFEAGTLDIRTSGSTTAEAAITWEGQLYFDANGNLLIGGTTAGADSVGNLHLYNGTIPSGSITNGVILYAEDAAASSELKVRDEAGNVTTLSPHSFVLFDPGPQSRLPWSFYSEWGDNVINVDMLKTIELVQQISGKELIHYGKKVNGEIVPVSDLCNIKSHTSFPAWLNNN